MSRLTHVRLGGLVLLFLTPAILPGQVIINTGIDTTLAEAGANGPELEHGGYDDSGNFNPDWGHPDGDHFLWEFDGGDGTADDGEPGENHGLIWFDIPADVLSKFGENDFAILTMHTFNEGDAGDMYRITSDWLSGPSGGNLVTWFNMVDGPGIVPGQNAEAEAYSFWPASTAAGDINQTDVSADVLAWAQGAPNYGWGFLPTGTNGHSITSFEDPDDPVPTLILGSRLNTVIERAQAPNTDQGHEWKYWDLVEEGDNHYPTGWNEPGFNDTFWLTGRAVFGHGNLRRSADTNDMNIDEEPEPDELPFGTVINSSQSGKDPRIQRETDLFRTTFNLSDVTGVTGVGFDLLAEDGAVIYINGEEVARSNLPAGPINSGTRAGATPGTEESVYKTVISPFGRGQNPLVVGQNTLAVELHQDRASSNDRGFDLAMYLVGDPGTEFVAGPELQAGDADQDLDFDQLDLVKVQIAAKYLTGQPATWGDGDWDGAPGGSPGNPPAGNGRFDQFDIIASQIAGLYLQGPYAAIARGGNAGDEQTSIVYNPSTGELAVDAPASTELTSINIDSAGSIFTGDAAQNLGGSFDNDGDNNIFKATFGSSFGSLSFGNVAQAGLSEDFVANDLTVVGSLAGGGDLGNVDLIYVPEPSSVVLLLIALGWLPVSRARHTWRR